MAQSYTTTHTNTIPAELKAIGQWLAYKAVPKPDGRINKPPIDAKTRREGSSTNPATWSGFELAAKRSPVGAAFVLTPDDPYFAIDIDHCVDAETGAITAEAQAIVDRFPIYWEVSYSNTGLRGIGRGVLPKAGCKKGNVEVYDHARYVVMTGRTLPGCETIRNCQSALTTWHNEVWPIAPEATTPIRGETIPTGETADIIERLTGERSGKAAQLLSGDASGFPSHSEARMALAYKARFYGAETDQIAEIICTSGLFTTGATDRERDRKAGIDATKAVADYRGEFWKPSQLPNEWLTSRTATAASDILESGATCTVQLAAANRRIRELEAGIAARDETIAKQAARLDAYSVVATSVEHIVASNQIEAGSKLAGVAYVMEAGEQQKRGKPAAELGRHIPGAWIARRAGVSVNTANRHLKRLADAGLIVRNVVAERVTEDMVDDDTGEIIPRGRTISRSYFPDQASELIAKFTSYQRPDNAPQHGGKRDLRCLRHPDSSTTTMHTTTCDECGTVLDEQATHHTPAECKHQVDVSTPVAVPIGSTNLVFAPDPTADDTANAMMRFALDHPEEPPPEAWLPPPGEAGNDWWTG